MTDPLHFSTEGLGSALFRPHGRSQWHVAGQVLRSDSIGPFNKELAQIVGEYLFKAFAKLSESGRPFAEVAVIRENALASLETLSELTQALRRLKDEGLAPCATAFVMAPEVEGRNLMPGLLRQSYEAAGWSAFEVFNTVEEAEVWVQSQLASA